MDNFNKFLDSGDRLWICEGEQLVFTSTKSGISPLLEYLNNLSSRYQRVVVFDRVTGNAAALLSIKAGCRAVFSQMGSQLAATTLDRHGIEYHFRKTVPHIQNRDGTDMCPMEKLSLGKSVDEFYRLAKEAIGGIDSGT